MMISKNTLYKITFANVSHMQRDYVTCHIMDGPSMEWFRQTTYFVKGVFDVPYNGIDYRHTPGLETCHMI